MYSIVPRTGFERDLFSYIHRHILRDRRPSTAACPVPRLLGDGDKGMEKVYGEEKRILYWAD